MKYHTIEFDIFSRLSPEEAQNIHDILDEVLDSLEVAYVGRIVEVEDGEGVGSWLEDFEV